MKNYTTEEDITKKSYICLAKKAMEIQNYKDAIIYYVNLLLQYPELSHIFRFNLNIAQKKYKKVRDTIKIKDVAICGWSLGHNAAGRVYTLANIYNTFSNVEIIGTIIPKYGEKIWEPIKDTKIKKNYFIVNNENKFILQAISFVLKHPYDIVHLSKPRMTNIFIGIIYKLIWNSKVLIDIDDEELAFVKADRSLSLYEYINKFNNFPPIKRLTETYWTQLSVGLYNIFDFITVCNSALKNKYGGTIIPHARNISNFNFLKTYKLINRKKYYIKERQKVILFFGTPRNHKGLDIIAQAISEIKSNDILFLIVGTFQDLNLKYRLETIKNCNFKFLPNQPIYKIPEILSIADCCVLFQDQNSLEGRYQTPAKISDALCANIPIIINKTDGIKDFINKNCIILTDKEHLSQQIKNVIFSEKKINYYTPKEALDFISIEYCSKTLENIIEILYKDSNINIKFYEALYLLKKAHYSQLTQLIPSTIPHAQKIKNFISKYFLPENIKETEILQYNNIKQYTKNKINRRSKIAVFTAIINQYDPLIIPSNICNSWDYIVFSDNITPRYTGLYELRKLNFNINDPIKFSRYIKTHPHTLLKEYDYTLWVDSNILIQGEEFENEVNKLINKNIIFAVRKHPDRNSILEEVEACKIFNKDNSITIDEQYKHYKKEGFPDNLGLLETGILLRNNNNKIIHTLNEMWWREIARFSCRDQLSIMYIIWKLNISYTVFNCIKDLREHMFNSCCLYPHGGISNRRLPAYSQPFFMLYNLIERDAIINDNEFKLLSQIQKYWTYKRKPRGRVAVYTAIIEKYDTLKIPLEINPEWDYICFTDQTNIRGDHPWQIRHIDYISYDNTVTARFIKTHPHYYLKEYEYSIWIDANILVTNNILDKCANLFENSLNLIGVILHPHRNCTYKEGEECKIRGLDDINIINNQLKLYKENGFPNEYGLVETNIIFRKHNDPSVINFNNLWWNEINNHSKRDQLSFMYIIWKTNIKYINILPQGQSVRNCIGFVRYQHGNKLDNKNGYYITPSFLQKYINIKNFPWWHDSTIKLPDKILNIYNKISVDIIICVHDALDDVKKCLESVDNSLNINHHIIIIDDASQKETKNYLYLFSQKRTYVKLIRNNICQGYTKSANIGLKCSKSDFVILLNSDTIVSKNWIKKLLHTAYSKNYIGIVGPLCNAASYQSIPFIKDPITGQMAINKIPNNIDIDTMDKYVETLGNFPYFPIVSLINGVCYAIKREVIDKIGYLDDHSFPVGYGEEDDYSIRAQKAGFMLAIATHCYIFHAKSKSFGSNKRLELAKAGRIKLDDKHGKLRIDRSIKASEKNPILEILRNNICNFFNINKNNCIQYVNKPINDININYTINLNQKLPQEFILSKITYEELEENRKFISSIQPRWHGIPSSIIIIIPQFINILAGGIRTIIMTANNIQKYWHSKIIFCILKSPNSETCDNYSTKIHSNFPDLIFDYFFISNDSQISLLPDSDISICTSWSTAFVLAKYNRTKAKFYFIQDYETLFYPAGSISGLIDETYKFGFYGICNSQGIGNIISQFGTPYTVFNPGVDHKIFFYDHSKLKNNPFQIIFYGRPNKSRNAFHIGIEALCYVKKYFGNNVRIISAGDSKWKPRNYNLDGIIENIGMLNSLNEVAELYRSSTMGLVFMLTPHPSYQPLEFMATGCITVTNANKGTNWLLQHNKNCMLTSLFPSDIAHTIINTLKDDMLQKKLISGGLDTISDFTWDNAFSTIRTFINSPR